MTMGRAGTLRGTAEGKESRRDVVLSRQTEYNLHSSSRLLALCRTDPVGREPWGAGLELRLSEKGGVANRRGGRNGSVNLNQGILVSSEDTHAETRLLSVKETAKRLGIARRTLEREVYRKKFPPPVRIGSKCLYFVADVEEYLARLREQRGIIT